MMYRKLVGLSLLLLVGCSVSPQQPDDLQGFDLEPTVADQPQIRPSPQTSKAALALLDKGEVTISPATAVVDEDLCSACKTCISLCPYTAITFLEEENVANINEALCKGCGTCVAACPAGAITGRHFTTEQIMAQIEGLFRLPEEKEVVVEEVSA